MRWSCSPRAVGIVLWLATAGASGCGTVAYKFGGNEGDFEAARARCRAAGRAENPEFERCMAEQDWVVAQTGEPAAASNAKKVVPAEGASPGGVAAAPAAKPAGAPSARGPLVVKAWFKVGGTADAFEAAKDRCVAKLGPAHRPDPVSHAVTPELLDCLRGEGWQGLPSH